MGDAAADALRAPFVLGDVEEVRRLVGSVCGDVRVDEITGTARFASIGNWVHTELRGWTLSDLVDDDGETALIARAERDLTALVAASGAVEFAAPALVATGRVDR